MLIQLFRQYRYLYIICINWRSLYRFHVLFTTFITPNFDSINNYSINIYCYIDVTMMLPEFVPHLIFTISHLNLILNYYTIYILVIKLRNSFYQTSWTDSCSSYLGVIPCRMLNVIRLIFVTIDIQ